MGIIKIVVYSAGGIFFISALWFASYALRNAVALKGPLGHRIIAIGAIFCAVSALVYGVAHFFSFGSGLVYPAFYIWIVALFLIIVGAILRGKHIQKVYRVPILRILAIMPFSKLYLIVIVSLLFVNLPLLTLSTFLFGSELSFFGAAHVMVWMVAFVILGVAERRFYFTTHLSVAGVGEEIDLLRDDILVVRSWGAITNTFLATIKPMISVKLLRDTLQEYFEYNPIVFDDCEINDNINIDMKTIVKNLDRIYEENKVEVVCDTFSVLDSKLVDLYGSVTSPKYAAKVYVDSYRAVLKLYPKLSSVFTLPEVFIATPQKYILKKGPYYLVKEEKPDTGYEIFLDQVTHGYSGLAVTKLPPDDIRRKYKLATTHVIWLTFKNVDNAMSPKDVDGLKAMISDFVKRVKKTVIILDCFDELTLVKGFDKALAVLVEVKDICRKNDANLLLSVNPELFEKKQLGDIEKEFEEVS